MVAVDTYPGEHLHDPGARSAFENDVSPDARFEALFNANYGDVLAYAVRRCTSRQDAEDVVAETFAVAWRRLEDLPDGDRARLWLFGTARLVRMNHHRTDRRRLRLTDRLRDRFGPLLRREIDTQIAERDHLERALAALSEIDREVLQLHAWEELSAEQIAATLEISTSAVWKRLQRARDRLAATLGHPDEPDRASR